jgi:mannose-6-phosphate isomerase-like protein (cupin superfamily)
MKKIAFLLFLVLPLLSSGQVSSLDTIKAPVPYDNIYSRQIASDSLSTSFVIFIKKEVRKHKHAFHSEQVIILEGEGLMLMSDKEFVIKKGDIIFIPKETIHALKVTSDVPVKAISIQSPGFDGSDRILID